MSGENFGCLEAKLHGPETDGVLEMCPVMVPVKEEAENWLEEWQPRGPCASVP